MTSGVARRRPAVPGDPSGTANHRQSHIRRRPHDRPHGTGTAREALTFYRDTFGGELVLHTYADFGREDGDPAWVAHGMLRGPVELFASDAGPGEPTIALQGILFSLLGTAEPATLEAWFASLAKTGTAVDRLQLRPWGDHDGQVTDQFGVRWLIGYQP